jgi:hypothetical protein
MKYFNFAPVFVLVGTFAGTAVADITINSARISAHAGFSAFDQFEGTIIPAHVTLHPVDGDVYNKTTIDWYKSAGQTILSQDLDHQRTGAYQSFTESYVYLLEFTANSNEPYKLSGFYNVTDVGAPGTVYFYAQLVDQTTNRRLSYSVQQTETTHNAHFILGGSLAGNLIAGHVYRFYDDAFMSSPNSNGDSGASAIGNITLTIGSAVPEPASIFLSLLLCGAAMLPHRSRRRSSLVHHVNVSQVC